MLVEDAQARGMKRQRQQPYRGNSVRRGAVVAPPRVGVAANIFYHHEKSAKHHLSKGTSVRISRLSM